MYQRIIIMTPFRNSIHAGGTTGQARYPVEVDLFHVVAIHIPTTHKIMVKTNNLKSILH